MRPVHPVQFVCLRCSHDEGLPLVRGRSNDSVIQCETCGTAYHTQMLYLLEDADEVYLDRDRLRSRYGLASEGEAGAVKYHKITAQSGIPHFRKADNVLLVSHRGRLVEIANQTTMDWQRIYLAKSKAIGLQLFISFFVASYIIYLLYNSWLELSLPLQIALIGIAAWAIIVPMISWAMRPVLTR